MKNYKAIAGNFKDYIRQIFKENGKAICIVLALQIVFSIGLGILYPNVNKVIYSIVAGAGISFDIFIFMMLLNNKNFWKVLWKYIIVGLGYLCGGILFVLISGSSVFLVVITLMSIGIFSKANLIITIVALIIFIVYVSISLIVPLLAYQYTQICIFDCIKNDISLISSISKQVELGLSNKIMLFFISMLSIIVLFGIGISETILVDINPLFRYIISVITPIANLINILVVHFIFTQLEAKYEVSQKEPCSID